MIMMRNTTKIKNLLFMTTVLIMISPSSSLAPPQYNINKNNLETRRDAIVKSINNSFRSLILLSSATITKPSIANASPSSSPPTSIEDRLTADKLILPPPSRASEFNGVDNQYYPSWLAGEWDAVQTMTDASTPLGLKFVGGPNGSESIASESVQEQKKQLNVPVSFKLRYVNTKFGVAEDRLFNTKARLNAFAGRNVVASVEYADVGGSNRASVVMMGGDENTPLQTTVVRFKGPAAQKSFLISHGQDTKPNQNDGIDENNNKFAAHEVIRSIFALTNTNTAPPVTTDTELIWLFEKNDNDHIDAKLRIASYLNAQSDKLYFEAKNQAVNFVDYDLKLTRAL